MIGGPSDVQRRADLRRMRGVATGLLALMLATWLAARWAQTTYGLAWLSYAEAFAEAAMVGGIADWFAVTALFRHPLGLPIPHTAIIPRNKDRLGASLGNFIAREFLTVDTVRQRLHSVDVARHLADWLVEPGNAAAVARRVAESVPAVIDATGDENVRRFMRDGIVRGLRSVEVAPVLGRVLSVLVTNRRHQALFDRIIDLAWQFLNANHDAIRHKISEGSKWWMPKVVDEKLFRKVVDGIESTLDELRAPDHPWRDQFSAAVEEYVVRLSSGEISHTRAEAIKEEILSNPVVAAYIDSVWGDIKQRMRQDAECLDGTMARGVERLLFAIGERLSRDEAMRGVVNGWVEQLAIHRLVPHRDQIAAFLSGVVHRWDMGTVVTKLELLVGRDLQYIRINGTVVGGAVGLFIHATSAVVG